MRISRMICTVVGAAMALVLAQDALAEEAKKAAPASAKKAAAPAMDMEAMMKQWEKFATPGAEHKALAKMVGKWNAETTMLMGPGAEPTVAKGKAEFTEVLGGRFVRLDFSGEFMGKPFTGIGYNGYDNFKKQYTSSWMDDMSTGSMISYGTMGKDGKSITFWGVMDEPMTGEKGKKIRSVMRLVSDDEVIYESYDKVGGKEWKALDIKYTRIK